MTKYFSEEYFREVERMLATDPNWRENTKAMKTTILLSANDVGASYILRVEEGRTSVSRSENTAEAEFSFDGTYEVWTKIAKGELDFQSAVLKGQLKFRGSITKILYYRDRFMKIADVIRSVQVEF